MNFLPQNYDKFRPNNLITKQNTKGTIFKGSRNQLEVKASKIDELFIYYFLFIISWNWSGSLQPTSCLRKWETINDNSFNVIISNRCYLYKIISINIICFLFYFKSTLFLKGSVEYIYIYIYIYIMFLL